MASSKVSLKLLIDTKGEKVLFAEAGKDFVDFLITLLSLPVGTVIRLLTKHGMVGCLGSLYDSIENLGETYMQTDQDKDSILKPKAPTFAASLPLFQLADSNNDTESPTLKMYTCRNRCNGNVSDDFNTRCPQCALSMNCEVPYITRKVANDLGPSTEGGFVKGVVTYMVMDDLDVKPMSTISSITMLNKFNVKEVGALQEKIVTLGMAEGVQLLRASLHSKTVLTSVFLAMNKKA
ncbi:DUF674 family protein [Quillaja saponaria]|uniref:DUF674 family protein n=1 Tax=Quillaja saponaria TaxID=32244 RepID=A0AAD7VD02_QUISA|nr:DUF674 family protein [Quillaja saponaria]